MTFTALTHKINVNKHYYIVCCDMNKMSLDPLFVSLSCYQTTTVYILCAHILVSILIERKHRKVWHLLQKSHQFEATV